MTHKLNGKGPWVAILMTSLLGCGEGTGLQLAQPDPVMFQNQVLPVLARDCGFHTCHGARERFFQVVGPGRPRLDPNSFPSDPLTPEELDFSYQRAVSMIDKEEPERSLLLLKPLAVGAGGDGHQGTDQFGRDVYAGKGDPDYGILAAWVLSPSVGPAGPPVNQNMGAPPGAGAGGAGGQP